MYDRAPPNMKAQFNLINLPNQSIKLSVSINNETVKKKGLNDYKYNNETIFKYLIEIKSSVYQLNIYPQNNNNHFTKTILGSFIYDNSTKYSISHIDIFADTKSILDSVVFGFLQKDFIYSVYKKNSKKSKYKSSYKLSKNNLSLINSIKYLKELVTEPSNVIYPTSFAKRTKSQINNKSVSVVTLDKKKITKIGMNCLLAVSQGSKREPVVMEFKKKNSKKNVDILFVGKGVCFDSGGISIKPTSNDDQLMLEQENGSNGDEGWLFHASSAGGPLTFARRTGGSNTDHFRISNSGVLTGTDTDGIGSISDERLKKDIVDFTYSFEDFKKFKPRKFNWKTPELHNNETNTIGFIAQELETVDTRFVYDTFYYDVKDTDEYKELETKVTNKTASESEETRYNEMKLKSEQKKDNLDKQYLDADGVAKASKLLKKDAMYISIIQQLITKIETLETKVKTLEDE